MDKKSRPEYESGQDAFKRETCRMLLRPVITFAVALVVLSGSMLVLGKLL